MLTEAATCAAVIGLDVGKLSHWACHVTRQGEVLRNEPVANTEHDLDGLFAQAEAGTLVVVDQVRNIGSLAISRARLAGLPVAYLPGIAAHGAAKLFAGDAKTDERDAAVIAKTALGIPDSLLPVPKHDERLEAARSMAAQGSHMAACSTRDKNRLRSILLESCPEFEALADLADPHWLRMMESLGGPWGIVDAGKAAVGAVTRGANRARIDAAVAAAASSARPSEYRVMAENPQVKVLARRIRESAEEAARLDAEITALLAGDETYACLLTIPGIGPRTASELVISIDIGDFPDHDHLASYCGIAPRNRRSGKSISSVSSSRQGNKRLKNLLIFSCNSLSRSKGRFGDYYRSCRERGMCHGEALKAVARKRLKVIYAIMRDKVPYSA
ncbi:MAG TPA: IS110 family transposase [Candidatus Aveggerthella excrementigallinarum]|nr:IS110 family transposase [Candidatus Aveggerthella excrementigallinarum]